jgi:hypothetical protein
MVETTLSDLTAQGERAVPTLIAVLKSKDSRARARAALGLEKLGGRAQGATEALGEALVDTTPAVIESAIKALTVINTPRSQQILEEHKRRHLSSQLVALKSPNAEVRSSAVRELFQLGPRARLAIPELLTLMQDRSVPVRTNAELTLMHLGVRQSQIDEAKLAGSRPVPSSVIDPPQETPRAQRPTTNERSGYDLIQRERNLLEAAEHVTFEQLRKKRLDYEGQYVVFGRVKFEDDPRLLYLTDVGDFLVVPLRDESGDRLSAKDNDSKLFIAVPTNLAPIIRDRRRSYPDYFFVVRAKLKGVSGYTIATITDLRLTE